MTLRERSAGTGLRVALKANGRQFVREFDGHDDCPWPVPDDLASGTAVVPLEPLTDVGCHTDVVALRVDLTPEDVHETTLTDAAHVMGGHGQCQVE